MVVRQNAIRIENYELGFKNYDLRFGRNFIHRSRFLSINEPVIGNAERNLFMGNGNQVAYLFF